jgi:hypothetical protein
VISLTNGQAAFVSGLLEHLQHQLESFAATATAAQGILSSDIAALAERMAALEAAHDAALGDADKAEVSPSESLSGPLLSDLSADLPPPPARANGPAPVNGSQLLQLPLARASGPARLDS